MIAPVSRYLLRQNGSVSCCLIIQFDKSTIDGVIAAGDEGCFVAAQVQARAATSSGSAHGRSVVCIKVCQTSPVPSRVIVLRNPSTKVYAPVREKWNYSGCYRPGNPAALSVMANTAPLAVL